MSQQTQNQQPPQEQKVPQFQMDFLAQRNNVQNLEKQLAQQQEALIGNLMKEIETRGKIIAQLQQKIQQDAAAAQAKENPQPAEQKPAAKELPGRPATETEIKKGDAQKTPPPSA